MKCDHICNECGEHEHGNWFEDVAKALAERSLCSGCDFWLAKVLIAKRDDVARVDGTHYMICKGKTDQMGFQGFGGQHFKIKFSDGREVETNNLWCQGTIPHRFRDRLPNNAHFMEATRPSCGGSGTK